MLTSPLCKIHSSASPQLYNVITFELTNKLENTFLFRKLYLLLDCVSISAASQIKLHDNSNQGPMRCGGRYLLHSKSHNRSWDLEVSIGLVSLSIHVYKSENGDLLLVSVHIPTNSSSSLDVLDIALNPRVHSTLHCKSVWVSDPYVI